MCLCRPNVCARKLGLEQGQVCREGRPAPEPKSEKPHKGWINQWAKQEIDKKYGLGYRIIGDFQVYGGGGGSSSYVVKHEGNEIETKNSRYTLLHPSPNRLPTF